MTVAKAILIGEYPRDRKIRDLEVGERAYTVPWACDPDLEELNLDFCVQEEKIGTAHMRVCKTENGYTVEVEEPRYRSLRDCFFWLLKSI